MEKKELNLLFMGTPEISAYVFEQMILDGYHFVGLVAQPDHPVGRKGIIEKVPTKVIAEKYNIPVFQPIKIRKDFSFMDNLTTIYASDSFVTTDVDSYSGMFNSCYNLVGGAGSTQNDYYEYTEKELARIDGGPSSPGLFTRAN
jgi:hypothetical protein